MPERRGHIAEAEDVLKEAARRLGELEPELSLVRLCILRKMFVNSGRYKEASELKVADRNGKTRRVAMVLLFVFI